MRSLFLLLPLLLVIALAGYVQGEDSSEVDSLLHPSQIDQQKDELSLIRNIRDPAKRSGSGNNSANKKKKKGPGRKKKGNGKGGDGSKDKPKPKRGKKKRRNRGRAAKRGGRRKNKPQRTSSKPEGKKKKKKKRKQKQRKGGNKPVKPEVKQASCTRSSVPNSCLETALEVMNFEKNQIQNFYKQKQRFENHHKVAGNKKEKRGNFFESAEFMLKAIGGNISAPTCGENNTGSSRSAKSAVDNYNTLQTCNVTIMDACKMPDDAIDDTKKDMCFGMYEKAKANSTSCREDDKYESDGTAACACWTGVFDYIENTVKKEKCAKFGTDTAKAIKSKKKECIDAFRKCKKAQDEAVSLIHACMSGEVNTNATNTGNKVLEDTGRVFLS